MTDDLHRRRIVCLLLPHGSLLLVRLVMLVDAAGLLHSNFGRSAPRAKQNGKAST